jgi:hypothetical protein
MAAINAYWLGQGDWIGTTPLMEAFMERDFAGRYQPWEIRASKGIGVVSGYLLMGAGAMAARTPATVSGETPIITTSHGSQRLAGSLGTRGGELSRAQVIALRDSAHITMTQADGATVIIREVAPGKYNVAIFYGKEFHTGWYHMPLNRLLNQAKRYGWK